MALCGAFVPPSPSARARLRRRQRQPPQPAGSPTIPRSTMTAHAAAWDQLPLGVQQRILLLTGHPSARRVSKAWRDTFDAANDTLCFRHVPDPHRSLQVTATATARGLSGNSASLTAVNYAELGYVGTRSLPLMLSDLLAAGAASGLATRLRKLTGVQVDGECAVQQLQALQQCTGLTHLGINGNYLEHWLPEQGRQAAVELTAALQGMRRLTCLYIRSWELQSEGIVAALASALQPLTQLQHLHLMDNCLQEAELSALAPTLSAMPGLQTLDVSYNLLGGLEGAQALCLPLGAVPGLTHLDVSGTDLGEEGTALLAPVLRGMTCLQTLNMCDTYIGDGGMAMLAPALAELPHLHTLDLSGNHLRSKAMSALQPVLAREGSPLRKLDIGHNRLELEGAHALAAGLGASSQLSGLSLTYVQWGNGGWAALAPALSCLAPSLQLLELGDERLDEFASAAALAPALQQLTGLTSLKACGALSSADMITISPALRSMRQLQVLNLYGRGLSADGLADFAAVLPALAGSLTHLDLSDYNISAEAAANVLAPALAQATGLVELHMWGNDFGPQGRPGRPWWLVPILSALYNLRLGGNAFSPQGSQWLVPVLSALPHLRELDLSSCKLGLQGCMAVVRALKDRDGMLVHLDNNGVTYGSSEGDELCHTAGVIVRL